MLNKKHTEINTNKEIAVAYVRLPFKGQAKESMSVEAQVERLFVYAELRDLDLVTDNIFIEEETSESTQLWLKSKGREMRKIIYQDQVYHLLTLKMDRLFRDVKDCIALVDEMVEIGVDLHILVYNGVVLDTSDSVGQLFLETITGLADFNKGQISVRTKIAMQHLKDNSKVFTGSVFGWDRDGDNLIPNWLEQDKIDYMRHWNYVMGWSGNQIAKHLNKMGIKGKLGGSWTSSMILRTCRYTFHENRKSFKKPEWWGKGYYHDSVDF